MKQEHTEEEDSDDVFEQWQVEAGGTVGSTPKIEWYFVTEPTDARLKTLTLDGETLTAWPSEFDADEKKSSRSKPRTPKKLEEFDAKRAEIDRRLAELGQPKMTTAMLVAIRHFTGTMGKQKYNVAMRAKASQTTFAAITKSPTAAVQGLDMRAVFESFDADGSGDADRGDGEAGHADAARGRVDDPRGRPGAPHLGVSQGVDAAPSQGEQGLPLERL